MTIENFGIALEYEPVCGVRVENPSQWAIVFQIFLTIQGKAMAKFFRHFCSEAIQQL